MKKNIKKIIILALLLLSTGYSTTIAAETEQRRPLTVKEMKQIDNNIATRLNLSEEQIKALRKNREANLKSMQSTIQRMEHLQKEINNTYIIGIPKFQADIKTATMKMELAILKQNADRIRLENRKNFEKILTEEQKAEFEIMKKEFHARHKHQ